jgi:hypothetical protein
VWTPGASLVITPQGDFVMEQGDTVALDAVLVQPNGLRQAVPAQWTSSNTQVISMVTAMQTDGNPIRPGFARAVAGAPGTATLFASSDTLRAQASVIVIDKQLGKVGPTPGDALVLDRFFVMEYECPWWLAGDWCYVPQIRASAAPGRAARIATLAYSIPGLGSIPALDCNAQLVTTTLRELNGESYGDWLFYISGTNRATAAVATVFITFVDDAGKTAMRAVDGPIVPGGLPSSSAGSGACFPPP